MVNEGDRIPNGYRTIEPDEAIVSGDFFVSRGRPKFKEVKNSIGLVRSVAFSPLILLLSEKQRKKHGNSQRL